MNSKLLEEKGLLNYIAGSDYNFRHKIVGDAIAQDIQKAVDQLGQEATAIYTGTQVHGKQINYCDGISGKEFVAGRTFPDTDGLITDQAGLALVIKYADCTPIVIYDPVKKVQASLHSGWRGTVQRISQHAIQMMVEDYQSNIEDLVVFLGPSIDQANYEVGPEVYDAFESFPNRERFFKAHGDKYLLSMMEANYALLKEAGIQDSQIDKSLHSTYESDQLHSARKEKENYGLNAIVTMIPKEQN